MSFKFWSIFSKPFYSVKDLHLNAHVVFTKKQ